MKKTCVFLAGILVIFIAFACEMPSSIELKSDRFEMNAPVKLGRFNLVSILTEALKDSFPEGFEIYDMVNYSTAQAFLIAYQMDLMESFNPDDYLEKLKAPGGIPPIYPPPIVIPKMTSDTISDKWFYFDMQPFFNNMQAEINDTSNPEVTIPILPHSPGVPRPLPDLPAFMVFKGGGSSGTPNFDAVFVHQGRISLKIWLTTVSDPNMSVTLSGIEMRESRPGYNHIGTPQSPQTAILTASNDKNNPKIVTINIDGATIKQDNPPQFCLGEITSTSSSSSVNYTLVVQPWIENITLRGAEKLKIGKMTNDLSDFPDNIIDNIELGSVDDMINADIAEGYFRIKATPPAKIADSDTTYCEGLKIGYRILVEQDSVWLDTEEFEGLNNWFWDAEYEGPPDGGPGGDSLANKKISAKDLRVNQGQIFIKPDADGVTFELFDDHYANKVLPIKLDMDMNIEQLKLVRWKTNGANGSILPEIKLPEINFANMGEQNVSFINWIEFREINLNIDFTVPDTPPPPPLGRNPLIPGRGLPIELENHIALKVTCTDLGFDDTQPQPLQNGNNTFTSSSVPKLNIHDSNNKVQKVAFDVELLPVIEEDVKDANFPYIEFGPVTMSGTEDIKMNIYAQVTVDFDWERVEIDLNAALVNTDSELKGEFPKEAKDQPDLSEAGKYMSGVKFSDNLKAKIFLSGPDIVVRNFKPHLDFSAKWGDDKSPVELEMIKDRELTAGGKLPPLPGKHPGNGWVYTDTALPEGAGLELTHFNDIITAFPQNLCFNYEMRLGKTDAVIVEHGEFNEEDDNKIRALMLLLLPLELEIDEDGGYFAIPSDIFGGEKDEDGKIIVADLFGRESAGADSAFTGVNIKSLGIKIDFGGRSIFAGSNLHFDEGKYIFGPNGLHLGNANSLNVVFTGEQQKAINDHLIYPDIKFVFPAGEKVQIARNFLPVRIVIAASGSYTLNLDDLLRSD